MSLDGEILFDHELCDVDLDTLELKFSTIKPMRLDI